MLTISGGKRMQRRIIRPKPGAVCISHQIPEPGACHSLEHQRHLVLRTLSDKHIRHRGKRGRMRIGVAEMLHDRPTIEPHRLHIVFAQQRLRRQLVINRGTDPNDLRLPPKRDHMANTEAIRRSRTRHWLRLVAHLNPQPIALTRHGHAARPTAIATYNRKIRPRRGRLPLGGQPQLHRFARDKHLALRLRKRGQSKAQRCDHGCHFRFGRPKGQGGKNTPQTHIFKEHLFPQARDVSEMMGRR